MSDRIEVAPVADFPPGERYVLDVEGVVVCVRNVDGDYYAIEGSCAHRGGPICQGTVESVEAEDRRDERSEAERLVRCPWHGWEYDLATGEQLGPAGASLATFEVFVEDDGEPIVRLDAEEICAKTQGST